MNSLEEKNMLENW